MTMKRMLFVTIAALGVCMAQAANTNWNFAGLNAPDALGGNTGPDLAGALVYGFVGTTGTLADDIAAASAAAAEGTFDTWYAGWTGGTKVSSTLSTSTGAGSKLNQPTPFIAGNVVDVFIIAFDQSTTAASTWFMASAVKTMTMPVSGSQTFNMGAPGGTYLPSNWTPIPEPTSLALLGVGAAVAALRRRMKK